MLEVIQATSPEHFRVAADLFRQYGEIPGIEVCLDTLEAEVASLPGEYAPPGGLLLLAVHDGSAIGCVGVLRITDEVCEMRRLFVRGEARGSKAGRKLAAAAISEAAGLGYSTMSLATLPGKMQAAVALYRSLGFTESDAHDADSIPGALTLQKKLP